jgi:hypothetical protein
MTRLWPEPPVQPPGSPVHREQDLRLGREASRGSTATQGVIKRAPTGDNVIEGVPKRDLERRGLTVARAAGQCGSGHIVNPLIRLFTANQT